MKEHQMLIGRGLTVGWGLCCSCNYQTYQHGESTLFKTPKLEGPMRDVIIVEIRTINGEPFKGTITYNEASIGIFEDCLGMKEENLHGVKFAFSGTPVIRFKLTELIDIDSLHHREYFQLRRNRAGREDILECKIRGIRRPIVKRSFDKNDSEQDPNIRWVTVDGCDYDLEEDEIMKWLRYYGETFGRLREDIHEDINTDRPPVGTGTYSIKMRLDAPIPQLLPMFGKKITIEFKGVQRLCTNCFGLHNRRACQSRKVQWIDYVRKFVDNNPDIPEEHYGRWIRVLSNDPKLSGPNAIPLRARPSDKGNPYIERSHHNDQRNKDENLNQSINQQRQQSKQLDGNQKHQRQAPNGHEMMNGNSGIRSPPTQRNQGSSISQQTNNQQATNKINQVSQIYDDLDNMNRLIELTDLGLTVDAAREHIRQEEEVDSVKQLLKDKKNAKFTPPEISSNATHFRRLNQVNQISHDQGRQVYPKSNRHA